MSLIDEMMKNQSQIGTHIMFSLWSLFESQGASEVFPSRLELSLNYLKRKDPSFFSVSIHCIVKFKF
jgi:hypothetical protein